MLEKKIENDSVKWARAAGWLTYKFASPSHRGVPDRVFMKDGRTVFIEFKTMRGRVTELQKRELQKINDAGVEAVVCRSKDEVINVLAFERKEKDHG
jgi:hypothetical protein